MHVCWCLDAGVHQLVDWHRGQEHLVAPDLSVGCGDLVPTRVDGHHSMLRLDAVTEPVCELLEQEADATPHGITERRVRPPSRRVLGEQYVSERCLEGRHGNPVRDPVERHELRGN